MNKYLIFAIQLQGLIKMYEKVAEVYDNIYDQKNYELETSQILKLLTTSPKSLLDIGCGTGNHAKFFAPTVLYRGIDTSSKMIAKAKQKEIKNAAFENIALSCITSSPSTIHEMFRIEYDVVVSLFNVINHIHTLDELLFFFHDVYSVSSPESAFIFDAWNGYAALRDPPKPETRNVNNLKIDISPVLNGFDQSVLIKYIANTSEGIQWSYKLKMTLWTPKIIFECLKIVGYSVKIYKGFGKDKLEKAGPDDYKILFHCKKGSR
jgi:SAM-dependent methyltransferase